MFDGMTGGRKDRQAEKSIPQTPTHKTPFFGSINDALFHFGIKLKTTNLRERIVSPPCYRCEDSRSQISCRIDGVSTVESKCHPYGHHTQSYTESFHSRTRLHITWICDSQDTDEKESCTKHLKQRRLCLFVASLV